MNEDRGRLAAPDLQTAVPNDVTRAMKARVTLRELAVHQNPGEQARSLSPSPNSLLLETLEDPYDRTIRVTPQWIPLDFGWLVDPALVWIENTEYGKFMRIPTPEERAELASKIAEIAVEHNGIAVVFSQLRPGWSLRVPPMGKWLIRSLNGTIRCKITACPK